MARTCRNSGPLAPRKWEGKHAFAGLGDGFRAAGSHHGRHWRRRFARSPAPAALRVRRQGCVPTDHRRSSQRLRNEAVFPAAELSARTSELQAGFQRLVDTGHQRRSLVGECDQLRRDAVHAERARAIRPPAKNIIMRVVNLARPTAVDAAPQQQYSPMRSPRAA